MTDTPTPADPAAAVTVASSTPAAPAQAPASPQAGAAAVEFVVAPTAAQAAADRAISPPTAAQAAAEAAAVEFVAALTKVNLRTAVTFVWDPGDPKPTGHDKDAPVTTTDSRYRYGAIDPESGLPILHIVPVVTSR